MRMINIDAFEEELYNMACIAKFGWVLIPIKKLDIALEESKVDAVPAEWVKKWFTRHINEMFEDYEEVVHCKNCRFYLQSNEKCELVDTRLRFYEKDKTWTGDCFCSWGERRDDDATD